MTFPSTPRDPGLDVLRRDYDALTHDLAASGPHPDEDMWVRFASGELSEDEQARIVDHVFSCAECSAVYRAVSHVRHGATSFDPAAPRYVNAETVPFWKRPILTQALAASLTIAAAGLLVWNVTLQQRAAELQAQLDRTLRTPVPPPPTPPGPAPAPPGAQAHVNVPIIDLHPPSRVRGEGTPQQVISLQANSALVTLIVNTERPRKAADFTLDLLDAKGTALWTGTGLRPQGDGTLSIALPTTLLQAGDYVFVLKERDRTIHRYSVRIAAR